MKSTNHILPVILTAVFILTAESFGNGCDLPSPPHPDSIQSIELSEGMIYRYPYSSFTAVADAPNSGSGHLISFKANQIGSFKIRIYRDLEGHSLVSDGETILDPRNSQASDTFRSFFCGPVTGPLTKKGLIEIEVISGSLTLNNLFFIEAYNGVLYYSNFDPSLLSIDNEPIESEIEDDEILISIGRSTLGHSYSIEESSNLSNWKTQPNTIVSSNGEPLLWKLDSKADGPIFYRIKETN